MSAVIALFLGNLTATMEGAKRMIDDTNITRKFLNNGYTFLL